MSASGTVVDQDRRLILTAGSLIAPFRKYKQVWLCVIVPILSWQPTRTALVQGTIIEVMFDESDEWVTCTLVDMRDIRVINESADRLLVCAMSVSNVCDTHRGAVEWISVLGGRWMDRLLL